MRKHLGEVIISSTIVGILALCSNPSRDNPFDQAGTNYHPPVIQISSTYSAYVNDPVTMQATPADGQNGSLLYHWFFDDLTICDTVTNTGTLVHRWPVSATGGHANASVRVYVYATDQTGVPSDTILSTIHLGLGAPTILACNSSSAFLCRQDHPLPISISAVDTNGSISMYYWGADLTLWSDSSTSSSITIPYLSGGGSRQIVIGVRDDDGILSLDTIRAQFNRRPQSAAMTSPAIGATATWNNFDFTSNTGSVLCATTTTDPDGGADSITYSLTVFDSIASASAQGGSPLVVRGLHPLSTCQWILIAHDRAGDSCIAMGTFSTPDAPSKPTLVVSNTSLNFGSATTSLSFTISNSGSAAINWSLSNLPSWLSITPASGALQAGTLATLNAVVTRSGLPSNSYSATLSLSQSFGTPQTITVTMIVPAAPTPVLYVSGSTLPFGSSLSSSSFSISNIGGGSLSWSANENASWLTLSPTTGTVSTGSSTVTATVSRTGLSAGSYSANIIITSNGGADTVVASMQVASQTTTTIRVINQLIDSVYAYANGVYLGKVPSLDSVGFSRTGLDTLSVEYSLIRRKTSAGTAIGEQMDGIWATVRSPGTLQRFIVTNILGSSTYFTPVITNTSLYDIAPIVNQANSYSNSCGCTVPANSSNIAFGYYTFISTTDVRAYQPNAGFSGPYVYWRNGQIDSLMQTGSGRVNLNCTSVAW